MSLIHKAFVKSSLMIGIGETDKEIIEVMEELRQAGCQILTIGQYLAPTQRKRHLPVERFYSREEFEHYRQKGLDMGFVYVESGPLVRSSYIAEKGYQTALDARLAKDQEILNTKRRVMNFETEI